MGSINSRGGRLFLDFRYKGHRCREYTKLSDTKANRNRVNRLLKVIEAEIMVGSFDYEKSETTPIHLDEWVFCRLA